MTPNAIAGQLHDLRTLGDLSSRDVIDASFPGTHRCGHADLTPAGVSSVRYSFTGAIKAPRTVLKDGYISWHDTVTNHWMQLRMFADICPAKCRTSSISTRRPSLPR